MDTIVIIGWSIGILALVTVIAMWFIALSKGRINIFINNEGRFHEGDKITGKVVLTVKKPLEKTGPLTIALICEEVSKTINNKGSDSTQTKEIIKKVTTLDDKSSYEVGEKSYNFSIPIPSAVESTTRMKDMFMGGMMGKKLKWKIFSSLEIPGFNISNSEKISVS